MSDQDLTLDGERYIRMPVKLLWLFVSALCIGAWAYADIRTQQSRTREIAEEAVSAGRDNATSIHAVQGDVMKMQQQLTDFTGSTERVFNRYFRDLNDPDYKKPR